VIFKVVGKFVLVLIPLAISGVRLHAHSIGNPADVTREINRCLSFVRVAAARRGADAPAFVRRERRPFPGQK
jgi:hypothetical protein